VLSRFPGRFASAFLRTAPGPAVFCLRRRYPALIAVAAARCLGGRAAPRVPASVSANPYAFWAEVAALAALAARLAGAPSVPWPVRGRAAALCYTLSRDVAPDEALCAKLVRAAFACVGTFPVVLDLLAAARQVAPDESRLVLPLRRLCVHAHAAGHHDTVVVTLVTMLDVEDFDGEVPAAWLVAGIAVDGEADYWLRRLVRRWVERFGANQEGIRAIIRDRADVWFPTRRFMLDVLRAMHAAEPTVAGWVALAGRRNETEGGALGLSFGERHAVAVAALREALLRMLPAATHALLNRWLAELST
jgi:hypothetical protein